MRTTRERRNYLGGEDDEGQRRPTDQGDAWPCGILLLRHLHATDLAVSTEVGGAQPRKRHAAGSRVLTQTCSTQRTTSRRRARADPFPSGGDGSASGLRERRTPSSAVAAAREWRTPSLAVERERRMPSPAAAENQVPSKVRVEDPISGAGAGAAKDNATMVRSG